MDDRIIELEREVKDLREAKGELSAIVRQLAVTVSSLNDSVAALRDSLNRGRGALWVIVGASSVVGAIATILAKRFLNIEG